MHIEDMFAWYSHHSLCPHVYNYIYILNTWYRIIQSWENYYSLVWWIWGGGMVIMTLFGIYSLKFYEYNLRSKFALRKLYTYKHVPLFKNLCSILTLFLIEIWGKEWLADFQRNRGNYNFISGSGEETLGDNRRKGRFWILL